MTVIVKHNKTNSITDWTQAQLDEQIALGNFPSGTTLANIVLPSDWNNDHTLTGVGTMAEQDATAVAITGGTINNTTIGATTATTGKFTSVTTPSVTATTNDLTLSAISTGKINFNTLGGNQVQITDATTAGQFTLLSRGNALNEQQIVASGTANLGLYATGGGVINFWTATTGEKQFVVSRTTSAVNYVQVTGATTTNGPFITAQGSDTNIPLNISGKGGSGIAFYQNGSGTPRMVQMQTQAGAVNYHTFTPSLTTNAPIYAVDGTDTNIAIGIRPKGTGAIDLAAGSSGVNISNGGTVTAVTITNNGASYTSFPTPAISAPTTAGGVQATISLLRMFQNGATVASGGTGYTNGDVLTVVGGTNPGTAATLTVTAVSSGAITAVSSTNFAQYTALPTNPVSVTGGTGSGATLNLTWSIPNAVLGTSYSITNAGSGYIEQPTITFSGGGGSGAAAYATVGSNTTQKTIGNIHTFATPNSNVLALVDKNSSSGVPSNTTVAFSMLPNQSNFASNFFGSSAPLYFGTASSSTTDAFNFATSVGTPVSNGGGGSSQFRIVHTASAVNYVQVTGAATGAAASALGGLSFTGSDGSPNFAIGTKGTGYIAFYGGAATNVQAFRINTTSAANTGNLLQVQGAAAGSSPSISAISGTSGTDADIDITLTPKGTGNVRFGTYTAGVLTPTGYVTIKDSGGTSRRLLVG